MSMQQNPSWAQPLGLRLLVCMDPGICISSDTAIAAPGTTRTELLPQGRNHFARKPPKGKRQKAVGRVVRKPQSKGGRGTHHLRRMERKVFMRDGGVAVSPGGLSRQTGGVWKMRRPLQGRPRKALRRFWRKENEDPRARGFPRGTSNRGLQRLWAHKSQEEPGAGGRCRAAEGKLLSVWGKAAGAGQVAEEPQLRCHL